MSELPEDQLELPTTYPSVHSDSDRASDHSRAARPARKRSRPSSDRQRRRAATACSVCRTRKTKCDNQRPACGTCMLLHTECVYPPSPSDHTNPHPVDREIINELRKIGDILRRHEGKLDGLRSVALEISSQAYLQGLPRVHAQKSSVDSATTVTSEQQLSESAAIQQALHVSAACASGRILEWPIFESRFPSNAIDSQFFAADHASDSQVVTSPASVSRAVHARSVGLSASRGLREEDVVPLVEAFLQHVHTKNPILEPGGLLQTAKHVAEEGFTWESSTCLIMLACALGCLATDFARNAPPSQATSHATTSLQVAYDYGTAEQYYAAARKRIGLIDHSLVLTQCSFLLGVYEMYSIRPCRAWLSFSRACMTFQTYLHCFRRDDISQATRHTEQRLYWSCLKSECEMREEITLVPTGLSNIDYPDAFPSPPEDIATPVDVRSVGSCDILAPVFERSWYYYLSEIGLRRISNQVTHALHDQSLDSWVRQPIEQLFRTAEELDALVAEWSSHTPLVSQGTLPSEQPDELHHMLSGRITEIRERIWRPFLYIAIHSDTLPEVHVQDVRANAEKALALVYENIETSCITHRHHGTWYCARQMFALALLLVATAKSGRLPLRTDWFSLVERVHNLLWYWEYESPDLSVAKMTLSQLMDEVQPQQI